MLILDDEQALFEETDIESTFSHYRQMGVNEVVIKRGAQGCLVQHDIALHEVCATTVDRAVDTTAAGDSFSAGYLATRLLHTALDNPKNKSRIKSFLPQE